MDDLPEPQKLLFLPVFFTNLSQEVPTSDEVDLMHLDTRKRITDGALSLDGIFRIIDKPLEIGPLLWRRLGPWIQFVCIYWDQLPEKEDLSELSFYSGILIFGQQFHKDPSTAALMRTTPKHLIEARTHKNGYVYVWGPRKGF